MSIWPNLGYRDAAAAIRFLTDVLGFETEACYGIPGDAIAFAALRWPGGGGVMLHSAPANGKSVADLWNGGVGESYPPVSVHLDVDDPDTLYARVRGAGATIARDLADSPLGTRGFIVQDPEGLYWSFGTPLPRLVQGSLGWQPERSGAAPHPD